MAHIDLLYKKNNPQDNYETNSEGRPISWARKTFHQNIVPACAAILLHDAHKSNFKKRKITKDVATLAWLLRVCDALQDWDRPKSGSNEGIPAENYRIGFLDGVTHFKCPQDRLAGIWNEDLEAIHTKQNYIQMSPL
jgi:hypothetical protein